MCSGGDMSVMTVCSGGDMSVMVGICLMTVHSGGDMSVTTVFRWGYV